MLGLIQVESGFKKYAISWVGARGYMQIMPFWLRVLAEDTDKHSTSHLFNMQTNIRFGCVILRHYLEGENGNLFLAPAATTAAEAKPHILMRCWQRRSSGSLRGNFIQLFVQSI